MPKIAAILAGGQSIRMGVPDKALQLLHGERLIDHVARRIHEQADEVIIAGPNDYGTGLTAIADYPNGPKGPAAGIYACSQWVLANRPSVEGFFTVPVDGPFLPADLFSRLAGDSHCAIAEDGSRRHPTFGYWRIDTLSKAWSALGDQNSLSLHALAERCSARSVAWADEANFFNVNTKEDLEEASKRIALKRP